MESSNKFSTLSGVLLVTGTCVGAGMLALPIVTGSAGFLPSLAINAVCWLFMLITGLLFLEATLWMKEGSNVLSMAERFFGTYGKWIGGISFLFLYYCLEVAYVAGGAPILTDQLSHLGFSISGYLSYFLFSFLFGLIIFLGSRTINRINWILMMALIISYVLLISIGSMNVQFSLLKRQNWSLFIFAAPTLFSAYGYHNIIPSLSQLMKKDSKALRLSIIIGTTLPFIIYALWQWITMGILSKEQFDLAVLEGIPVTESLHDITGHPWMSFLGNYFGFFALITSFLGVSLSMVDFMSDGFKVKNRGWIRFLLCLLVFIPPSLIAGANPHIFLSALGVAGGFGEAILNGLFPIGMVWVGRYVMQLPGEKQVFGGKKMLIILSIFTLFIILLEILHLIGATSFSS